MISLITKNLNKDLTQEIYDDYINSIDVHSLMCSCGQRDTVVHGYYSRKVKTSSSVIDLVVLRVKCKRCCKTHAVILSNIVPYQPIQLEVQIRIILNDNLEELMISNISIDEQTIYRVKQRFRSKYKTWMNLNNLSFKDDLVFKAYKDFKSNYLQVRKVPYSLCGLTTQDDYKNFYPSIYS